MCISCDNQAAVEIWGVMSYLSECNKWLTVRYETDVRGNNHVMRTVLCWFTKITVAECPFAENTVAECPFVENTVAECPFVENTVAECTFAENTVAECTFAENTVAECPFAENTVAECTFAENTVAECTFAENTVAESPFAEQQFLGRQLCWKYLMWSYVTIYITFKNFLPFLYSWTIIQQYHNGAHRTTLKVTREQAFHILLLMHCCAELRKHCMGLFKGSTLGWCFYQYIPSIQNLTMTPPPC